jgi:hypothetical protein
MFNLWYKGIKNSRKNIKNMKTLIVGMGEVGIALHNVLKEYYDVYAVYNKFDKEVDDEKFDIIHITFPYSGEFENEVSKYQQKHNPKYTVIHSTVPVGISRKLNAFHSPIRGKHPHLYESILTFEKILGGEKSDEVADYFRRTGMKILLFRKQESAELSKLLDTLYYGLCIEFCKEAEKLSDVYDVPFSEIYTLANNTYNEGYSKMGDPEYIRPVLQPIQKKIGGHCVLQNAELLESKFTKILKDLNKGR